jgi:uncharacterized protein (DUF2461 family)
MNRDTRFSKDKTPSKLHSAAYLMWTVQALRDVEEIHAWVVDLVKSLK